MNAVKREENESNSLGYVLFGRLDMLIFPSSPNLPGKYTEYNL